MPRKGPSLLHLSAERRGGLEARAGKARGPGSSGRPSNPHPGPGRSVGVRKFMVLCVVVAGTVLLPGRPAQAACHHFSVAASPNPVTEGETATVTVSRDAALAPSNIDVSTVDETAKAGADYTALHQTVDFTNETSRTFPVKTIDDNVAGGPKTFRLHLSNPGGCAVNPNYVVDPDAHVTINDSGRGSSTTASLAPGTTGARAPSSTRGPATTSTTVGRTSSSTRSSLTTASTAASSSGIPASTTSALPSEQAAGKKKGGGGSGPAVAGIIAAIVVIVGAGGYGLYRWRRPPA